MKKTIPVILLLVISFSLKAQKAQVKDSLYQKKVIDNKSLNVYFGAGYQKKFYYEIGIANAHFQGAGGNLAHWGYYTSYERTLGTRSFNPVHGAKVGAYFAGLGGAITTEVKYLWFGEKHDWIITPKFGIGLGGMFLINYGYNISLNKRPFEQLGQHQFSLVVNLPFWMYKDIRK